MDEPPGPAPHDADLRLAQQALAGSSVARQDFARRMECVPRMLAARNARLAVRLSWSDLEDLVQDTLASIWRRLDTYAGMATLETWAWRYCQHHLANRLRARGRAPLVVPVGDDVSRDPLTEPLELYDSLHQALERLEPRDALVVRLRHFEQLGFAEIGSRLAISPNTAKSRHYRGLRRLRALLEPERRREAE